MLWEAVITAAVAGFAPSTLLIVAGLLSRESPMRHALVFLATAAAVTLMVGFLVVETLGSTDVEDRRRHRSVSPAIDLGLGLAILLLVPYLVHRMTGTRSAKPHKFKLGRKRKPDEQPSHWRDRAGVLAAVVLGLFVGSPNPLYLASLQSISKSRPAEAVGVLEVLLLAAIVLVMAEASIILYAFQPARATALLDSANTWLARHGRVLVIIGVAGVGCFFTVDGLVRLL